MSTKKQKRDVLPTCVTPGCRQEVGWSKSLHRYAVQCQKHLEIHRQRNKISDIKRKLQLQDMREKAAAYPDLCATINEQQREIVRLKNK
jgi:hypothetical protein